MKEGVLSLEKLVDLMANNPRKRFGIAADGFSVWDLTAHEIISPQGFLSKGKSTPFLGCEVCGVNLLTVARGRAVYRK